MFYYTLYMCRTCSLHFKVHVLAGRALGRRRIQAVLCRHGLNGIGTNKIWSRTRRPRTEFTIAVRPNSEAVEERFLGSNVERLVRHHQQNLGYSETGQVKK